MELHEGELSETSHMKIRIKIIFMSEDQHAQYSTSIPLLFPTNLSVSPES